MSIGLMLLSRSIVINEAILLPLDIPVLSLVSVVLCVYRGGKFGVYARHPAGAHVPVFRIKALASGPA